MHFRSNESYYSRTKCHGATSLLSIEFITVSAVYLHPWLLSWYWIVYMCNEKKMWIEHIMYVHIIYSYMISLYCISSHIYYVRSLRKACCIISKRIYTYCIWQNYSHKEQFHSVGKFTTPWRKWNCHMSPMGKVEMLIFDKEYFATIHMIRNIFYLFINCRSCHTMHAWSRYENVPLSINNTLIFIKTTIKI